MTPLQRALLAVLGPLAPDLAVGNGSTPESDLAQRRRWSPATWPIRSSTTAIAPRLARFIVDGGERVRALAPRWRVPTLLLYAGSDRCVAAGGQRRLRRRGAEGVVTAREFPPLFHEIFNEPEQAEVLSVARRLARYTASFAFDRSPR